MTEKIPVGITRHDISYHISILFLIGLGLFNHVFMSEEPNRPTIAVPLTSRFLAIEQNPSYCKYNCTQVLCNLIKLHHASWVAFKPLDDVCDTYMKSMDYGWYGVTTGSLLFLAVTLIVFPLYRVEAKNRKRVIAVYRVLISTFIVASTTLSFITKSIYTAERIIMASAIVVYTILLTILTPS